MRWIFLLNVNERKCEGKRRPVFKIVECDYHLAHFNIHTFLADYSACPAAEAAVVSHRKFQQNKVTISIEMNLYNRQ